MRYYLLLISLCLWSCTSTNSSKNESSVVDNLKEETLLMNKDTVQNEIFDDEIEGEEFLFEEKEVIRTQENRDVSKTINWENLEKGLHYAVVGSPIKTNIGDSKVDLLRINPNFFDLSLETTQKTGKGFLTAPEWSKKEHLIAVFNAGMFQMDAHGTTVGFMKRCDKKYNGVHNNDKTYLAFLTSDTTLPNAKIIDRQCDDWEKELNNYESALQSIRMYSCTRKNVWGQQKKYWSMVVVGETEEGEIFFAFTRSPYSVHDFVNILVSFKNLKVSNLMYLEGGPEASFYLNHESKKVKKMGSYETDFNENDHNNEFWGLPNVIGIRRK